MVVMQLSWVWHVVSAVNVRDRACGHEAQQESVKQEEGLQGLCLMSARFACLQSCDGTARVFTGRCNPCICTAKAAVSCRSRSSRHVIASLSVNLVVQATQTAYTHTHIHRHKQTTQTISPTSEHPCTHREHTNSRASLTEVELWSQRSPAVARHGVWACVRMRAGVQACGRAATP